MAEGEGEVRTSPLSLLRSQGMAKMYLGIGYPAMRGVH
jgi:hypothetical protein